MILGEIRLEISYESSDDSYEISKIVSMIRKYHNHKLQTNPWHRDEELHMTYFFP